MRRWTALVVAVSGKRAVGGGGTGPLLSSSKPVIVSGVATGWEATASEVDQNSSAGIPVDVWAICVNGGN